MGEVQDDQLALIESWEWLVLYEMVGSVVCSLKKMNVTICDVCFKALLWTGNDGHPCSLVLEMMEFKKRKSVRC